MKEPRRHSSARQPDQLSTLASYFFMPFQWVGSFLNRNKALFMMLLYATARAYDATNEEVFSQNAIHFEEDYYDLDIGQQLTQKFQEDFRYLMEYPEDENFFVEFLTDIAARNPDDAIIPVICNTFQYKGSPYCLSRELVAGYYQLENQSDGRKQSGKKGLDSEFCEQLEINGLTLRAMYTKGFIGLSSTEQSFAFSALARYQLILASKEGDKEVQLALLEEAETFLKKVKHAPDRLKTLNNDLLRGIDKFRLDLFISIINSKMQEGKYEEIEKLFSNISASLKNSLSKYYYQRFNALYDEFFAHLPDNRVSMEVHKKGSMIDEIGKCILRYFKNDRNNDRNIAVKIFNVNIMLIEFVDNETLEMAKREYKENNTFEALLLLAVKAPLNNNPYIEALEQFVLNNDISNKNKKIQKRAYVVLSEYYFLMAYKLKSEGENVILKTLFTANFQYINLTVFLERAIEWIEKAIAIQPRNDKLKDDRALLNLYLKSENNLRGNLLIMWSLIGLVIGPTIIWQLWKWWKKQQPQLVNGQTLAQEGSNSTEDTQKPPEQTNDLLSLDVEAFEEGKSWADNLSYLLERLEFLGTFQFGAHINRDAQGIRVEGMSIEMAFTNSNPTFIVNSEVLNIISKLIASFFDNKVKTEVNSNSTSIFIIFSDNVGALTLSEETRERKTEYIFNLLTLFRDVCRLSCQLRAQFNKALKNTISFNQKHFLELETSCSLEINDEYLNEQGQELVKELKQLQEQGKHLLDVCDGTYKTLLRVRGDLLKYVNEVINVLEDAREGFIEKHKAGSIGESMKGEAERLKDCLDEFNADRKAFVERSGQMSLCSKHISSLKEKIDQQKVLQQKEEGRLSEARNKLIKELDDIQKQARALCKDIKTEFQRLGDLGPDKKQLLLREKSLLDHLVKIENDSFDLESGIKQLNLTSFEGSLAELEKEVQAVSNKLTKLKEDKARFLSDIKPDINKVEKTQEKKYRENEAVLSKQKNRLIGSLDNMRNQAKEARAELKRAFQGLGDFQKEEKEELLRNLGKVRDDSFGLKCEIEASRLRSFRKDFEEVLEKEQAYLNELKALKEKKDSLLKAIEPEIKPEIAREEGTKPQGVFIVKDTRFITADQLLDVINDTLERGFIEDVAISKNKLEPENLERIYDVIIYGSLAYSTMHLAHALAQLHNHYRLNILQDFKKAYAHRNYIMHGTMRNFLDDHWRDTLSGLREISENFSDRFRPILQELKEKKKYSGKPVAIEPLGKSQDSSEITVGEILKVIRNVACILQDLSEVAINANIVGKYFCCSVLQHAMLFYVSLIGASFDKLERRASNIYADLQTKVTNKNQGISVQWFQNIRKRIGHDFSESDKETKSHIPVPYDEVAPYAPYSPVDPIVLLSVCKHANILATSIEEGRSARQAKNPNGHWQRRKGGGKEEEEIGKGLDSTTQKGPK